MKPDEASLRNDMEEAEVVPMEVFMKLGLLVVESRVPEPSPKGRREGPHCPSSSSLSAMSHSCEQADFLCKRSTILEKQMSLLWKNRIPMCIEVLMYSQCGHGAQKVQNLDFSLPTNKTDCVLLEQWNIQAMPRRHGETVVRVRELFQALRSYLYFSQISAWLNATHGQVPSNVAYRISPPGEFCTSSFQETPEWHTFPLCSIGKSACLKVTVGVIRRRSDVINVSCPEFHNDECPDSSKFNQQKKERPQWNLSMSPWNSLPEDGPVCQNLLSKSSLLDDPTITGSSVFLPQTSSSMQNKATAAANPSKDFQGACASSPKSDPNYAVCKPTNTGAIPKRYVHKSPPTWGYKCHSLATPALEPMSRSPELGGELPAVPKVLMSKKSPKQTYYHRDEQRWTVGKSSKDSDSDHSSPEIDHYLKNIRTNLEPLSPEEIQTYLASLSIDGRSRSVQTPKDLSPISANPDTFQIQKPIPTLTKLQLHSFQDLSSPDISFEEYKVVSRKKSPQLSIDLTQSGEDLTPTGSPRRSPSGSKPTKRAESPLTRLLRESDLSSSPASDSSSSDSLKCSNGSSCFKEEISVENGSTKKQKISDLPEEEQILSIHDRVSFSIGGDEEDSSGAYSSRSEQSSIEGGDRKDSFTADESDSGLSSRDEDLLPDDLASPFSPTIPGSGFELPTRPRVQKSLSEGGHLSSLSKSNALFKTLLRKEVSASQTQGAINSVSTKPTLPSQQDEETFRDSLHSSAKKIFHSRSGLPLQSSPAPIKKRTSNCFDFDSSLVDVRAIKNSFSCVNLDEQNKSFGKENKSPQKFYSASAPASTNSLLGSFEESILNGRLEPSGVVEGFTADIGASGAFCPPHLSLPVTAFFFNLSDDNAPSPYLGHINLDHLGKRGYHIPKKGTIQVTLFNPNKTVVKMFVVVYDLNDMPSNCQTFIRQRTLYMPVKGSPSDLQGEPVYLRYLIHLRFSSSKSGKVYLHTDLRLIFARDKLEFDARVANYELRSHTEGPTNPQFSPKK